jgi:pilus assembly protein CpaC
MRFTPIHRSTESLWILLSVLASLILAGNVDSLRAQPPPGWTGPGSSYQQPNQNWSQPPGVGQQPIQLVQRRRVVTADDTKPKRPLPFQLKDLPGVMEEMDVIHRRSQLVIAKTPVSRIAIADDTVIDVVQYSPTEFGIIGLAIGTTNLHLWFDDSPEPLIYLIEVIRDPTFEDRLRTNFGKLEKQLQVLFPYSTVQLIPLQQRLVVRGQARDAEEAARILQIVRSAFFNQFGN